MADLHEQLCGVVGSLSDKVSDVLKKQENEFLSAYRAHMYNVQKELQELRSKVKNAEFSFAFRFISKRAIRYSGYCFN